MKVASIQLNIVDSKPDKNYDNFVKILDDLPKDIKLVLLPELWTTGYVQSEWKSLSSTSISIIEQIKVLTSERDLMIGFSIIFNSKDRVFNRFLLIKSGEVVSQYDKSHLFRPMDENIYLTRGEKISTFEIDGFKIAPTICYDLRFPEMYRNLALSGVNLFLVSAEWPKPRCETLLTLARARAIENQAFLILSNRVGIDGSGVEYCSASSIILPNGDIIEIKDNGDSLVYNLDINLIESAKKFIQPLKERVEGVDFNFKEEEK